MKNITTKNYIMAIYEESRGKRLIRTSDVARVLGYKSPSVTESFQKMAKDDIITYIPHIGVKLTRKGKEIAEKVIERRKVLRELLIYLGIPKELAENESKKFEMAMSKEAFDYINVSQKRKPTLNLKIKTYREK